MANPFRPRIFGLRQEPATYGLSARSAAGRKGRRSRVMAALCGSAAPTARRARPAGRRHGREPVWRAGRSSGPNPGDEGSTRARVRSLTNRQGLSRRGPLPGAGAPGAAPVTPSLLHRHSLPYEGPCHRDRLLAFPAIPNQSRDKGATFTLSPGGVPMQDHRARSARTSGPDGQASPGLRHVDPAALTGTQPGKLARKPPPPQAGTVAYSGVGRVGRVKDLSETAPGGGPWRPGNRRKPHRGGRTLQCSRRFRGAAEAYCMG